MKEILKYAGCFVCGDQNDIGLKAKFLWDGKKAICEIPADTKFEGYKNIFHGGIVSTLLDEIMIKALLAEDVFVVTAEMTIRFKKPVFIGDKLRFEGWKTGQRGPLFMTEGKAVNQDGEIVAEASGKYIRPKTDLGRQLLDSLE
ncbi:MAG: PaaI family thioesterase [FCB group bacterium]|nr:PaaI family thioesterase [FCB group bacterium]